jgi:hypothetical protein
MMISPAYAYWKAPDQEHFLGVEQTRQLFRQAFADGHRRRSPLFLDFLEGKADFGGTAWGIPSYSVFGWQRPCYLMSDSYASTYKELIKTTDWPAYGRGAIRAAPRAWRTAATSPPRCWPPWVAEGVAPRPVGRLGRQDPRGRDGMHVRI